ncbi:MAG: SH3 domain-containing protein [Candidatus Ventricola sp.]
MKKWFAALCASLVLGLLAASAAAASYGTAVIDAGNSTKVHLRAEATTKSDSLGLYFTGTQVQCKSDPEKTWVKVGIGTQSGYMMSRYLRWGSAADQVIPRQPAGWVSAPNYANLRTGPSTEYQIAGRAYGGDRVTILGETAEHWYYVDLNGTHGFISAKLVNLQNGTASSGGISGQTTAGTWRSAYLSYVRADTLGERYALLYVNDDDVPELAVYTGAEAGGCQILTYVGGKVDLLQTHRLHFTYVERGNLLCNDAGHMGYYYDLVYRIGSSGWEEVARGTYSGYGDWDEQGRRVGFDSYTWNDVEVTEGTYHQLLDAAYPSSIEIDPFEGNQGYSRDAMLSILK